MIPGSANPLLLATAAAGGYSISRSVRFNSSDSAYLSRTPASAGNRKTWTYSFWFKLAKVTGYQYFLSANDPSGSGSNYDILQMDNNASTIAFYGYNGSSFDWLLSSDAVFRDPSAWQHFVISFDTTQSTASNRVKWWHNGNLLTLNRSGYTTYPSLNTESRINNTVSQRISDQTYGLSSYVADIHFCDGTAYDASAFGEFDANGIWQPKKFAGVYGTNGFKLNFSDNSTTAALGTDTSGNGNTWSVNNISVTAGAGNDSLVDVPTNGSETDTGAGGQVRGNYCTLNPLNAKLGTGSVSNGNLDFVGPSGDAAYNYIGATFGIDTSTSTGWYYEVTQTTYGQFAGVALLDQAVSASALNTSYIIGHPSGNSTAGITYTNNGTIANYGAALSTGNTAWTSNGDVIGIAIKDNKIWFAKNGTWISGSPSAGTSPSITLASAKYVTPALVGINSAFLVLNAGARPFAYTAPSGFKALNTSSLPAPVITKPSTVMDVALWSGNGGSQTITLPGAFSPDLVWIKRRSSTFSSLLYDTVRGNGPNKGLISDSTTAEGGASDNSTYGYLSAFNSDGFSLTAGTTSDYVNTSGQTYVGWTWDAGSSTVTNTQGSISSQVRANASAGFSVVSLTTQSSGTATVGHGLNVAPAFIIQKIRTLTADWYCYHTSIGAANTINLNTTGASSAASTIWNSTAPTSTVWTLGNGWAGSYSTIAYCFAPVAGYSSMGSYTGDGSTSGFGPFIHCGFRPKFVLIKGSSVAHDWLMLDAVRNPYNLTTQVLYANSSTAEMTNNGVGSGGYESIDILSNGFQIKSNSARYNQSGATYIYFAVAESPFQYARAR